MRRTRSERGGLIIQAGQCIPEGADITGTPQKVTPEYADEPGVVAVAATLPDDRCVNFPDPSRASTKVLGGSL